MGCQLQKRETLTFCYLSRPVCGPWFRQPQERKTAGECEGMCPRGRPLALVCFAQDAQGWDPGLRGAPCRALHCGEEASCLSCQLCTQPEGTFLRCHANRRGQTTQVPSLFCQEATVRALEPPLVTNRPAFFSRVNFHPKVNKP